MSKAYLDQHLTHQTKMKRVILITTLFFILLFLASSEASACSCSSDAQEEEFKQSEMVFIGEFVKETGVRVKFPNAGAKFKITKSWKGRKKGKTVWITYIDFIGCGYDIEPVAGKKYLIYARRINGKLTMDIDCGRSRSIEDAAKDIENMKNAAENKSNQ